jgi:hypothetical protein
MFKFPVIPMFLAAVGLFCAPLMATGAERYRLSEVPAGSETFGRILQSAEAAGLLQGLSTEGDYTIFAPTEEAFNALPEGALNQLLNPESAEARTVLQNILTRHIVPGQITPEDLSRSTAGTEFGVTFDAAGHPVVGGAGILNMQDARPVDGVIWYEVNALVDSETQSGIGIGPDICRNFPWLEVCGGEPGQTPDPSTDSNDILPENLR